MDLLQNQCNLCLVVECRSIPKNKPPKPPKPPTPPPNNNNDSEDEYEYDESEEEESSEFVYEYEYKAITSDIQAKDMKRIESENLWISPILLRSNILIDASIGKQLINLIKPLQGNKYNFRDKNAINCKFEKDREKAKLQELICQFQHYKQYTQLTSLMQHLKIEPNFYYHADFYDHDVDYPRRKMIMQRKFDTLGIIQYKADDLPIGLAPTIYSMKQHRFMTEINGLLYKHNVALYALIENIFIKMLPLFEICTDHSLDVDQLEVIIKIQDYQFTNENEVKGRWHSEGNAYCDKIGVIAVGLYYFDVTEDDDELKFEKDYLEIAEESAWNKLKYKDSDNSRVKVDIQNNDCIVFVNGEQQWRTGVSTKHRAVISTKCNTDNEVNKSKEYKPISRKMLSFFLLDPSCDERKRFEVDELKFINFPWKMEVILKSFLNYNMEIVDNIPQEIMLLITNFAFGDEIYQQNEKYELREERNLWANYRYRERSVFEYAED